VPIRPYLHLWPFFAAEAAHQIKPEPVVGSAPEVVFYYQITGGTATDTALLRISGRVEVSGVSFVQTW
jgi:hypothetical protein